jgi:hypothetical protein
MYRRVAEVACVALVALATAATVRPSAAQLGVKLQYVVTVHSD